MSSVALSSAQLRPIHGTAYSYAVHKRQVSVHDVYRRVARGGNTHAGRCTGARTRTHVVRACVSVFFNYYLFIFDPFLFRQAPPQGCARAQLPVSQT